MKRGAALMIAVIFLLIASAVGTYLMISSFVGLDSIRKIYLNELNAKRSKLISTSIVYSIFKNLNSYTLDASCGTVQEEIASYLENDKIVGYGEWPDLVRNSECVGSTSLIFSEDTPFSGWSASIVELLQEERKKFFFVIVYRGKERNFESVSWTFVEYSTSTSAPMPAEEVHGNALYAPSKVSLGSGIIWMGSLDVYGPLIVGDELQVGAQRSHFHDEVVADKITVSKWFGRTTFDKDVYTNELVLKSGGGSLTFGGNLIAGIIKGSGWTSRINVAESVCATSIDISGGGRMRVGGDLKAADKIKLENFSALEVGRDVASNEIELRNIWGGANVGRSITTCKLVSDDVDLSVSNALIGEGNFNGGSFECKSYLCSNGNVKFNYVSGGVNLKRLTVLGKLNVENSPYNVSDEGSVVRDYYVDTYRIKVRGVTYAGLLTGDCRRWAGGFYKKVYSPQEPEVECLRDGWQRIDQDELDKIPPCFTCPIPSCFIPDYNEKLSQIEETADPFPDTSEYMNRVKSITENVDEICSSPPRSPIGIYFDRNVTLKFKNNDEIMRIYITSGRSEYSLNYVATGCPYYEATLECGDKSVDFRFNGVIMSEGDMDIGVNSWRNSVETLYGRLILISNGKVTIYTPLIYDFLGSNSNSWPNRMERAYNTFLDDDPSNNENTFLEIVSKNDISLSWQNWWFGGRNNLSGELISLDGKVLDEGRITWRSRMTIAGGIYAKNGVDLNPQRLTLITDKRLTLSNFYTCDGTLDPEDLKYEPFELSGEGTQTEEEGEAEVIVVR